MALVPTDLPQRLRDAGLVVNVESGWENRGGSADHDAVVLHWTASSKNESPTSCKNYCFYNAQYAPDYNMLVDRTGVVWLGARLKSNSSGDISGTALNEVLAGQAQWASAGSRGLSDTTSANSRLWAISAQNDGVGEPWSAGLVNGMTIASAVVLKALGLPHAGYLCHHAGLTRRKVDLLTSSSPGVPTDWQQRVNNAMQGTVPTPVPEDEMWTITRELPPGDGRDAGEVVQFALPEGRKAGETWCMVYLDAESNDGCSLYGSYQLNGTNFGMWDGGHQWELWIPGRKAQFWKVRDDAYAMTFVSYGNTAPNPSKNPLLISIYGT